MNLYKSLFAVVLLLGAAQLVEAKGSKKNQRARKSFGAQQRRKGAAARAAAAQRQALPNTLKYVCVMGAGRGAQQGGNEQNDS